MSKLRELLPDLEPPPGGLAKLRARLDEERARRRRRALRWALAPTRAAAALLLFFLLPRGAPLELDHPALDPDWPALELTVDGRGYEPHVEGGVIWVVP